MTRKAQICLIIFILLALPGICLAQEDTWTRKANMPTARSYLSTSVVKGKIYALGGIRSWNNPAGISVVEEYTPEGWPFSVSLQNKLTTAWGNIKRGR